MKRHVAWLFGNVEGPRSAWRVVKWWEVRRLPFNLIIGLYGALCLVIFFWAIETSGHLEPGEDAVEPLMIFAAPIVINILYTLGWLVEVSARLTVPTLSPRFGPLLLKLGFCLGLFLITLPAAYWVGYRIFQLLGIAT